MQKNSIMQDRDYTLIIDQSKSMSISDQSGGQTRWEIAQESTLALARKCEEMDPDGITVYFFSCLFKRYDNITSDKVAQIYQDNKPMGFTDLAGVLADALKDYFERKAAGQAKANGETILVVTDGRPNDRKAVMRVIIEASCKIDRDEELAISLVQVGNDPMASLFLKALDNQLQDAGAKFDIVDTISFDDMEDLTLTEVLLNAITD